MVSLFQPDIVESDTVGTVCVYNTVRDRKVDSCMQPKKKTNLRIVCTCGQRMKVTRAMYGKAAKCVACHRKWFVPEKDEIPADTTVIYLKDHPELLRKTGVFVRAAPAEDNDISEAPSAEISAPPRRADIPESAQEDTPFPNSAGADAASLHVQEAKAVLPDRDASEVDGALENGEDPDGNVPAAIHAKGKTPFDTWDPLRLLCNYQQAFERLEQRVLGDEEPGVTPELLSAYDHSLQNLWDRLRDTLRQAHTGVQRQLAGIEKEVDRLTVALRVGEVDLAHFISSTAALRQSRESLVRLAYNLQAWQQVEDPLLAGGELDVSLDTFDPDGFDLDPPRAVPTEDSRPLPMLYSDELRAVMQVRATAEQRRAEWKRLAQSRPGHHSGPAAGLAENKAELKQVNAKITFLRQRMQQLVADCAHDLDSLHKYRRDALERDRKKQLKRGVKDALLHDIEKAESDLVRIEAYLRQTLHANASSEVPLPTPTLMDRLQPQYDSRKTFHALALYIAGMFFILPVLFQLSLRETGTLHRIILLPGFFLIVQPAALLFRDLWLRMVAAVFLWTTLCAMLVAALLSFSRYTPLQVGRPILPFLDSPGVVLVLGFFSCGLAAGIILAEYHRLDLTRALVLMLCCAFISSCVSAVSYAWAQRDNSSTPYIPAAAPVQTPDPASGPTEIKPLDTPLLPDKTTQPAEAAISTEPTPGSETDTQGPIPAEEGEIAPSPAMPPPHTLPVVFSLIGVVHGQGVSPLFRASLLFPDGTDKTLTLRLGQTIVGDWSASEYNAESTKLTITNGKKLLVLNPGENINIDVAPTAEQEPADDDTAEDIP